MHPAKRNLIIGLLLVAGGVLLNTFLFSSDLDRASRKLAKLKQPVPLAEYSIDPQGPIDFVFVDQFEPLGEQVEFTNDFATISYLPVRAKAKQAGGEVRPDVFLLSCAGDTDINHFIAEGTFKGVLIQPSEKKQNLSDDEKAIQAQYPDLDPRDAAILLVHTPTGQRIGALFAFGLPAFAMAFMIWWYCREMRQDRKWRERAEAFQPSDLDAFPKAVRLVHADCSPLPSSLTPRPTDPSYDVPGQSQQAYAKARVIGWSVVAALVSVGVVVAIQILLFNLGFRWNQGVASVIGFSAVFSLAQFLLHQKINSTNKLRAESSVEEKKARYRQTAFHQYHDKVLRKLGFSDLGDYQLVTASTPGLKRTIYLSSQGNTLVEVGHCFFTIKTLTNDGKFLETHSQVSKHQEKRDSNARHLRHSAKHENILQALEEHDDLVAERNYGGSVLEAQFTEERFGRFLAWADRKTSEPVSIGGSHEHRAASQLKSAIRV